jgi:hypothetical protein
MASATSKVVASAPPVSNSGMTCKIVQPDKLAGNSGIGMAGKRVRIFSFHLTILSKLFFSHTVI